MNAGSNIPSIWRIFAALAFLYCLILPNTELQLGAWQTDLPQETVMQRARYFRSLGIRKPKSQSILTVWEAPSSYDQLLAQADLVVLGKFQDQGCRLSGDRMHIETVYVFRVDQVISGKVNWAGVPVQNRILPEAETKALRDDEVFVIRIGGKLELFGVQMEEIETAFPAFKNNQTYILFLHIPSSFSQYPQYYGQPLLQAYETISGPHSVIKVDKARAGESGIETFVNNPLLRRELEAKFQSKLSRLLEYLKKE